MTKRRRWRINPAQACYLTAAILLTIYAFGLPILEQKLWGADETTSGFSAPGMSVVEAMRDRSVTAFFVCWIFFVGSAFGSFLNVVAFRMPRGESFVSSASRCPFCETPILARDNIPVFGWLGLRGRCRACHLPIATRYPKVEAAVGAMVLWLAIVELLSGGGNLPGNQPHRLAGIAFTLFTPDWRLIALTLMHIVLMCMLVVWRLMEIDRSRTPPGFIAFGWIVALGAAIVDASFHPLPWIASPPGWLENLPDFVLRLATPVGGGIIGAALAPMMVSKRSTPRDRAAIIGAFSVIGAMLGWQASLSIATLSAIGFATLKLTDRWNPRRFPVVLAALLVHLSFWKFLAESPWWPGGSGAVWGYVLAAVAIVGQYVATRNDISAPPAQTEPAGDRPSGADEEVPQATLESTEDQG
jgi:leader peptidase (prepilin peptidase)/N-methyltransferase